MRILCLHGTGSNSQVFELQTAAIRRELSDHTFEFVEGSNPCPAAPGIQQAFPESKDFFSWFEDDSVYSARASLDDLKAYIAAEGPFDGVMGFSAGAGLAATLMLEEKGNSTSQSIAGFRFAIFICGVEPWCLPEGRRVNVKQDGEYIAIPVANIYGSNDDAFCEEAKKLGLVCNSKTRHCLDHGGGHEIPRGKEITRRMVQTIIAVMDEAIFNQ